MSKEITLNSLNILKKAAELYYNNAISVSEVLESSAENLVKQIVNTKNIKRNKLLPFIERYKTFLTRLNKTITKIEKEDKDKTFDILDEYEANSNLMSDHSKFNLALKDNIMMNKVLNDFLLSENFLNLKKSDKKLNESNTNASLNIIDNPEKDTSTATTIINNNNKKLTNEDYLFQKMQEAFPDSTQLNKTFLKKKLKRKFAYENDFDYITLGELTTLKEMPTKSSGLHYVYLDITYELKDKKEQIEEFFKSYFEQYAIIDKENEMIIGGKINLTFEKFYLELEDEEKAKSLSLQKIIINVYNFIEELMNDLEYNIEKSNISMEDKEKYSLDYKVLTEMRNKHDELKSVKNR
jgi:hypothetical protein